MRYFNIQTRVLSNHHQGIILTIKGFILSNISLSMSYIRKVILCFLVLSLIPVPARSQFLINGTRDETVTSIKTDNTGILYFSTLRGLFGYDGRDMAEMISEENVNDFLIDSDRTIWFCGQYYIGKKKQDKTERYQVSSFALSDMTDLTDGRIAFTHNSGISVFDKDSGKVISDYTMNDIYNPCLVYDPDSDLLWLSSRNTVWMFDTSLNLRKSAYIPEDGHITSMTVSKSEKAHMVMATTKGIFALGKDIEVTEIGGHLTGSRNIPFITTSPIDGTTLALVEGKGIMRIYDDLTVEHIAETDISYDSTILGFLSDRNHLWISPDNISVYSYPLYSHYRSEKYKNIESFFSKKRITVMNRDSRNAIWSLVGNEIYRYSKKSGNVRMIHLPDIRDRFIWTMHVTSDDRLIICTNESVYGFDIMYDKQDADKVTLIQNKTLSKDIPVYSVMEIPERKLVLRTFQGIMTLSEDGVLSSSPDDFYPLFSDPHKNTVLRNSGNKIILSIDDETIISCTLPVSDESANIGYVDRDRNIWCITDRFRLYRIRTSDSTFEEYDIPQWQPASGGDIINPIYHSIQSDSNGNIWLGTSYGLVKVNPHDPDGYRLYNTGRKYDYYTASLKDEDGLLYFAYSNGVSVFDPLSEDNLVSNTDISFRILNVFVNNISIDFDNESASEFKYTDNTLTFMFSLVDFDNLQARYAWKLEGYETGWNYGTYRFQTYPNLPDGEYRFLLKLEGMPDSMAQSYSFAIKKKPWVSNFAISSYILFILGALTYGAVSLKRRKARQEKERIREIKQRVDEMKIDVFTNLSHEFRTPLTLISVPLKDMLYDEGCPEEITSKFKIMQRNVEKLQRLTDQLLEYDRIDKSPAGLELRKKDIVRDLSEIAENFQYTAQKNGSSISIDSYDSLPYTYDDIKFGRIMSNLLSNAIKYSPDGGSIKISAKLISGKQASLIYGSEFITDCLEVIVSDQGKGIPADSLESIFEKYTRANTSGYQGIDGFGIGLNYTRQLVQAHGGRIIATNNEPSGSVFRFVIPDNLKCDHESSTATEIITGDLHEDIPDSISGLSILVVEDNDDMREYLTDMFSRDHQVTYAADGQQGLEAVKSQYFDIVISDIMMPVMDGYELCKAIRQDSDLCSISVVLLTAKTDTLSQVHGLDAGADAYVSKPFDPMYLRTLINNIAKRRSLRQTALSRMTSLTIDSLPDDIGEDNEFDKKFMENLYTVLDKHLKNEFLDVNVVLQDMCMSRTSFYMKVKALTGQSPLQFINCYRMNTAAELLKMGKYSIKEVALMVGYQERRSFTNRFKMTFGCTPTEYGCIPTESTASVRKQ